jgi:hypothetical protein
LESWAAKMIHLGLLVLSFALNMASMIVKGTLIGLIGIQQVFAHIKTVKRLFLAGLIAFITIDMLLFLRRFLPFDEASTLLVLRTMFSLSLFAAATIGTAATVLYKKPRSASLRELYADTVKRMFLPFFAYMTILLILFIVGWTLPISLELKGSLISENEIYVPILEPPHLISLSFLFAPFVVYPTAIFWLASRKMENVRISHDLKMFSCSMVGLAVSILLQPIFLSRCLAETIDIIRMPCLIVLTFIFRKITTLQDFYYEELRQIVEIEKNESIDIKPKKSF